MSSYDIIIVNYNGKEIISDCLRSVYKSSVLPQEVIVVDNASTDDSIAIIRRNFPRVKIISSNENLGFGRGNNLGMEVSSAKFILLLNSDVLLERNCAKELLKGFTHDNMAVINSMIYKGWEKRRNQPLYAFGAELNEGGFAYALLDKGRDRNDLNNFSAACAMARAEIIKKIKFEKTFFLYYEEPILSVNFLKLGYKIGRAKKAVCYHLESFSSPEKAAGGVAFRQFYGVQNRFFMLGKHWPFYLLLKVIPINLIHLVYVVLFSLLHKKFLSIKLIYLAPKNFIRGLKQRNRQANIKPSWAKQLSKTSLDEYASLKKKVFLKQD